MEITSEQGLDIAKYLCGGKLRSAFSAAKDAHNREMEEPRQDDYGDATEQKDEKEEDEEVYYFDLVQVMSLLLIPELVNFADRQNTGKKFLTASASVKLTQSLESDVIMRVVIDSLTEIFDEDVQQNLRRGGRVDKRIIQQILLAFGDVDAANDPEILQEMVVRPLSLSVNFPGNSLVGNILTKFLLHPQNALGGRDATLTTDTFLRALTADVKSSFVRLKNSGDSVGKTSTFFDVFGWNWENPPSDDTSKGGAPAPVNTASFIDYAADSYGSVLLNTAVWCLFILTSTYIVACCILSNFYVWRY